MSLNMELSFAFAAIVVRLLCRLLLHHVVPFIVVGTAIYKNIMVLAANPQSHHWWDNETLLRTHTFMMVTPTPTKHTYRRKSKNPLGMRIHKQKVNPLPRIPNDMTLYGRVRVIIGR